MTLIRPTRIHDIPALQDVERSAGERFRSVPELAWIADDGILSAEDHARYVSQGAAWVSLDLSGAPVGFVAGERVGDDLHVAELAVALPNQGEGRGRALLRAAIAHARAAGCAAVTLTTFRELAWNEPFYARLGFRTLGDADADVRLRQILTREAERGLPAERRCAMRLSLRG